MSTSQEQHIVQSWHTNAALWTKVIRTEAIESRRLVTNPMIEKTVLDLAPKRVLDLGCGEGWLARNLAATGIDVLGVDVVPALIDQANALGGGSFEVHSFEDISAGALRRHPRFDVVVANFVLLGQTSVEDLLKEMPHVLTPTGALVIQTVHPLVSTGDQPYECGWRQSDWTGFIDQFEDPYPWYFRTISNWVEVINQAGLRLTALLEPLHPQTGKPASILFIAQARA